MGGREFSCIKQVVKTVQIPLPATFISNEIAGIAEILESWKRQYKKQLQGVVVNYKHYSLSSSSGFIAPNRPFVYYNVTATFDLFCPNIGDIVKGRINRISKEHVGCLIEETINVTIHLSKDSPQELAHFINLNREILFEISYFNYDRKMIRVTGKITPKCIQLMKDLFPPPILDNSIHTPELSNNTDEGIGTSSESTDEGLLNHNFSTDANNDVQPKKKKKKKSNPDSGSVLSLSSSSIPIETLSNTSAINKKVKTSKKRKRESESSFMDTSEQSTADEMPSKKRKHKDMAIPFLENEIKDEPIDMPVDDIIPVEHSTLNKSAKKKKKHKDKSVPVLNEEIKNEIVDDHFIDGMLSSVKQEISSPRKTVDDTSLESTKKKKSKDKKSKDKNKKKKSKDKDQSKKKKGKVLASGDILKKDKKSRKKGSKKNNLDGEQSKKHKKGKSNRKDKSEKKKKKDNSKNKVSDVIKSEID